jgi:hypothetical protein
MLAAAGYYWSRGFGWIRSFRAIGGGRYVYAQEAAGHSAETVSMSFRFRDLIQLEGAATKRDAETGSVVHESRFHRLLYLPPRAVAETVRLRVEDGLLLVEVRAAPAEPAEPSAPPKPPRSLGGFS